MNTIIYSTSVKQSMHFYVGQAGATGTSAAGCRDDLCRERTADNFKSAICAKSLVSARTLFSLQQTQSEQLHTVRAGETLAQPGDCRLDGALGQVQLAGNVAR